MLSSKDIVPVSDLIGRFDQLLEGIPLEELPSSRPLRTRVDDMVQIEPAPVPPPSRVTAAPSPPSAIIETDKPLDAPAKLPSTKNFIVEDASSCRDEGGTEISGTTSLAPKKQIEADPPGEELSETAPTPASDPTAPAPRADKKRIRQHWDGFLKYVRERQPWSAAALQMATSVERKEDQLIIRFADSADCTMLKQRSNIKNLSEYLLDFFQENLSIQFEVPGSNACNVDPANGLAAQHERRALANDPLVLTALEVFTGQVGDIRMGPPYRTRTEEPSPSEEVMYDSEE